MEFKFKSTVGRCDICFNLFNKQKHLPLIICSMHHTICKDCLQVLRRHPTCPFCRQTIVVNKVAVNNYILELIPHQGKPNLRQEASKEKASSIKKSQKQYNEQSYMKNQLICANDNLEQNKDRIKFDSANSRAPQYVYPDGFENELEDEQDEHSLAHRIAWHRLATFLITVVQLPFIAVDFMLVMFYPYCDCMDIPHGMIIMVLRPWLATMCFSSLLLLTSMTVINKLQVKGYLSLRQMLRYGQITTEVCIAKVIIWGIVELGLLAESIVPYCSNQIVAYGLVLLFFHFTTAFLYICHKMMTIRNRVS